MSMNACYIPNITAAGDLTGQQYRAVKFSAAGTVTVVTAATDDVIGILQNAPNTGEEAIVCFFGECQWQAGGVVTLPDHVHTAADGDCIAATTAQITQAMVFAGSPLADGDIVTAYVNFINVLA